MARWQVYGFIFSSATVLTTCSTPKLEFPSKSRQPQVVEARRQSFTDWVPAPPDQDQTQLRKTRDASYNKSSREHLFAGLSATMFVDKAWIPRVFTGSSTVVLARVTQAQAHLSEDQLNLYTEWTAQIEEIWGRFGPPNLRLGQELLINRVGGAIRMPSGEKFETVVSGVSGPLDEKSRYVLFLRYRPKPQWFDLEKAWQVENGRMVAVDPEDDSSAWQGAALSAYRAAYQTFKGQYIHK